MENIKNPLQPKVLATAPEVADKPSRAKLISEDNMAYCVAV